VQLLLLGLALELLFKLLLLQVNNLKGVVFFRVQVMQQVEFQQLLEEQTLNFKAVKLSSIEEVHQCLVVCYHKSIKLEVERSLQVVVF
jgi:hypothetical protein